MPPIWLLVVMALTVGAGIAASNKHSDKRFWIGIYFIALSAAIFGMATAALVTGSAGGSRYPRVDRQGTPFQFWIVVALGYLSFLATLFIGLRQALKH
jgi:hypothetical protein